MSAAHDDACLAETLEKFEIALSTVLGRKGVATAKV